MDKEEKDDEITIDFGKVKGFFKKKKENKEDKVNEITGIMDKFFDEEKKE